jgi:ribosomal protein S18 acetylase RimI-like enzyme
MPDSSAFPRFSPARIAAPLLAADRQSAHIEDAGLNASQPPEQLLVDGWLLRFSPGKAKRARSVAAITSGRGGLEEKLAGCRAYYERAGLPLIFRITPFVQPAVLDGFLQEQGFSAFDESRVMVRALESRPLDDASGARASIEFRALDVGAFADLVGRLRQSPHEQVRAHERRLRACMLSESALRLGAFVDDAPVAVGQTMIEGDLAGLFDIVTAVAQRGRGYASALTTRLLQVARDRAAQTAYLQVDLENSGARRLYTRLGFVDRYAYWYRQEPVAIDERAAIKIRSMR